MPRSKVQFQKDLSDISFVETYGNEEKCIEHVKKAKWPNGFIWAQSVYVGGNINEMSKSFQITCVMISTNQHICISSLIAFYN